MRTIILRRRDFKYTDDDGGSFFDDILYNLGVPEADWPDIEQVNVFPKSFITD